jgi:hypothetical protein
VSKKCVFNNEIIKVEASQRLSPPCQLTEGNSVCQLSCLIYDGLMWGEGMSKKKNSAILLKLKDHFSQIEISVIPDRMLCKKEKKNWMVCILSTNHVTLQI